MYISCYSHLQNKKGSSLTDGPYAAGLVLLAAGLVGRACVRLHVNYSMVAVKCPLDYAKKAQKL